MTNLNRVYAVVVVAAFGPLAAPAQTRNLPDRCSAGSWSQPIPLVTADKRPVYIERGTITSVGDRVYTLGGPTFIWETPNELVVNPYDTAALLKRSVEIASNFSRSGVIFDRSGKSVPIDPIPSGGHLTYPVLFRNSLNELRAVWGQDTTVANNFRAQRLWMAKLTDTHWNDPALITSMRSIEWAGRFTSHATVSNPVFASRARDSSSVITVGLSRDGRWMTSTSRDTGLSGDVEAVESANGLVVLRQNHSMAVRFEATRFEINGEASLKPTKTTLLDSATSTSSAEIKVVKLQADSVLAMWKYRNHDDSDPASILHVAISPDGGQTWTSGQQIELAGFATSITAATDASGRVHLAYEAQDQDILGGEGILMHIVLAGGRLVSTSRVTEKAIFGNPTIGPTVKGVVVHWAETLQQHGTVVPRTYAAFWDPHC